jgi:hypothetical protein
MTAYVLLAALAVLAVVVPRWGADTRDGKDWQPTCPRTGRPH